MNTKYNYAKIDNMHQECYNIAQHGQYICLDTLVE